MSTGATHIAFGICVGLATSAVTKQISPDIITYSALGALLSDFDTKKSTISNLFPMVAIPIDALTKHRGLLHWGTPIALYAAYWYLHQQFLLWLAIGSASHYGLDVMTKIFGITCNSMGERMLYRMIWIINIGMIINIVDPDMIGRIMESINNFAKEW